MSALAKATWRDPGLGARRELELPQGTLRYFESGTGPALVFVHGLLVNANLWRKVVPMLARDFRCITLDMPFGSHAVPMAPGADLTPNGLADLVADALAALDLEDVTLVGNDSGGAVSQIVVTRRPERIGRLVLTSCDYRDVFPPAIFLYLRPAARIPGALKALVTPLRMRFARYLPFTFGWLVKRRIDRPAEDSYVLPAVTVDGIEADIRRVIPTLHKRYTQEAAAKLGRFERPALIAWSREDKVFGPELAEGLARDLPNSRLEWIDDARTFSMEDNPERVAELIGGFVREPAGVAS